MLNLLLAVFTVLLLVPLSVLTMQILVALKHRHERSKLIANLAPPVQAFVVLIPAHNEELGLANCLSKLQGIEGLNGTVLVVADNCTDETASIARSAGAQVVERFDTERRGKGYALQCGVDAMRLHPPESVVVLDADCNVSLPELRQLVSASQTHGEIVQSRYLMHAPAGSGVGSKISEFAWLLKTHVRPLGTSQLAGCVQLLGSGMAFPWRILSAQALATGHVVEDLKLTIELAAQGTYVRFCPAVVVHSDFPAADQARLQQSSRWEHGHLQMVLTEIPRLLVNGLLRRDWRSLALALDIAVPPLSLFAVLLLVNLVLNSLVWLWTDVSPLYLVISAGMFLIFLLGVAIAWRGFATHVITAKEWLHIPAFALKKLSIYRRFVTNREKKWVRTDRE